MCLRCRCSQRALATPGGLPFHIARKKVPYIDASGDRVEPKEPNALKFERFIFDLLPHGEKRARGRVSRSRKCSRR